VESPSLTQRPVERAQENELFDCLRGALVEMPENMAEACCLRFIEQFSYEDIAVELDITVNHVGVLLTRAKAELKRHLAPFSPIDVNRTIEEVSR
jgi:RNA polymerase sigma-70 factor (ECF subfamily)